MRETRQKRNRRIKAIERYAGRARVSVLQDTTAECLFERACNRANRAHGTHLQPRFILDFANTYDIARQSHDRDACCRFAKRTYATQSSMRAYRHPPIQEAICEFHLAHAPWTLTTLGDIYTALRHEYPQEPVRQQQVVGTPSPQPNSFHLAHTTRVAFKSEDETRVVMAMPGAISAHIVGTYRGFEEFLDRSRRALEVYWEICKATGIRQVGVRYINRISVPDDRDHFDRFFTRIPPRLSENLGRPVLFSNQETFACPDGGWLVLGLATPKQDESEEGQQTFVLDLNAMEACTREMDNYWTPDEGIARAQTLHNAISEAFESSITNHLREEFENGD